MTKEKEKENKIKQEQEIVGLEDGDIEEEEESTDEKKSSKLAFLNKYKKYLLPASIAIGSFIIAIVGAKFLANSGNEISEEVALEDSGEKKLAEDQIVMDEPEFVEDGLDTAAIMSELAFLDYTPEMEAEEKKQRQMAGGALPDGGDYGFDGVAGMTPQDSVDTLNWLGQELEKLDKARADNAKQIKDLKALEYKIDQALIKIEQAESSRIINVARLYDGMRPEQVGKLFENLSDKAVMAILPRMKSANAAKIMAIMPPKRAARISTKMITILEK